VAERFRRALGGYDRAQVDAAMDARDARLARLEGEAQRLAERVVEREKRLQDALGRLGDEAENLFTSRTVSTLTKGLEEIYSTARKQATRIRMKALDDAVQMADRVTELTKLRDELRARVLDLADTAGIKLGGEDRSPVGTEPTRPFAGVYSGEIDVEVGPLRDFGQLTGFEDAASGIEGASEIRVRRFAEGRATFSMNLDSPIELLRELEERAPFEFRVRDTRSDQLILDVDDDAESHAA
jgi:hypothetical protein